MHTAWFVLLLAGCDRLLGLDPITPLRDAPATQTITGTLQRSYVPNDTLFQPAPTLVPLASDETATARLDDGTPVAFSWIDQQAGTFSFDVPVGSTYVVTFTYRGGIVKEIHAHTPVLLFDDGVLARRDQTLASPGTKLAVQTAGMPMDQTAILTSGAYTIAAAPLMPASIETFQASWDAQPLLDASKNDHAYLVDYAVPTGAPYKTIAAWGDFSTTLVDGTTTTAMAPTMPLPKMCKHVIAPDTLSSRFTAWPAGFSGPFVQWAMYALVAPRFGVRASYLLAVPTGNGTTGQDVMYSPIFRGVDTYVAVAVSGFRMAASPPVVLGVGTATFVRVSDQPTCDAIAMSPAVELPAVPSLAGTALASDGLVVALPAGAQELELAWGIADPGTEPATSYVVQVHDATAPVPIPPEIYSAERRVTLDPATFQADHDYYIVVSAMIGRPNAASGDFTLVPDRIEIGTIASSVFRVAR